MLRYDNPIAGNTSPSTTTGVIVMGLVLAGTGSLYPLDRAESWRSYLKGRAPLVVDIAETQSTNADRPDIRTAAEHIENIREVLNPSVSDLAGLFDVSRQAIYKWLAGSSTPEADKLERICQLSKIADALVAADVSRADSLLKMKAFGGRSLMELIKSGENRPEHLAALIQEARVMETSYRESGLATTKAKPTSAWQSSISIPGTAERT